MTETNIFSDMHTFWAKEDKEKFKSQVIHALNKGINKQEILDFLEKNKPDNHSINEDFEEWAYMLIVTEGASNCPPG